MSYSLRYPVEQGRRFLLWWVLLNSKVIILVWFDLILGCTYGIVLQRRSNGLIRKRIWWFLWDYVRKRRSEGSPGCKTTRPYYRFRGWDVTTSPIFYTRCYLTRQKSLGNSFLGILISKRYSTVVILNPNSLLHFCTKGREYQIKSFVS